MLTFWKLDLEVELFLIVDDENLSFLALDLEIHRNRIALDVVQQETALTVESQLSNLSCVQQALDALGVHKCSVYDLYIHRKPGPLHGVRAAVKQIRRTQATLFVHTRLVDL